MKKIINSIMHPARIYQYCSRRGWLKWMSDEKYIKKIFKLRMGYELDLSNVKTFNEKLQWLKLYNRNPLYTKLVDKYAVREHIEKTVGPGYLIPLLGVWDSFDEIDFEQLPDRFVLKCNHDSSSVIICKDKSKFDKDFARKKLSRCLKNNGYNFGREWPYKDVPRKIIAEQYMEDKNGELNDYKFFCFNGEIDCVMVVTDRAKKQPRFYYMSEDWRVLPYGRLTRSLPKDFTLPKPDHLKEMFDFAHKLSKGFPHVRIDLYNVDGRIYFGEYTFFHKSGFEDGFDEASDLHLGSLIKLPPKTCV